MWTERIGVRPTKVHAYLAEAGVRASANGSGGARVHLLGPGQMNGIVWAGLRSI